MSDIAQIREKILKKTEAQRLVIKVHTDQLDSHDYRVSAGRFVDEIFPNWEEDNRIHFLAIEIRGDRAFMVVDINNSKYDFNAAHEMRIVLPVHVVWHKRQGWFNIRWPQEDEPLATKIAELHNLNGFDITTPFLANFNQPVVYDKPRDVSRLPASTDRISTR